MKKILLLLLFSLFSAGALAAPGALDPALGGTGIVTTPIGTYADEGKSVIQQQDGKLLLAGPTCQTNGTNCDIALVRYNLNGTLDTSFNGTGKVVTHIGLIDANCRDKVDVIQQADGKLVVAGSTVMSTADFLLLRYNLDGSLDSTFNGTGIVTTDVTAGQTDRATALVQQSDGKLLVAGYSSNGANDDFAIVRYNSDGSLDGSFGGSGRLKLSFGASLDRATSVLQQADGKLLVGGYGYAGTAVDFVFARFNNDGSFDTTFNGTGKLTSDILAGKSDYLFSLIQQADGKLVAFGYSHASSTEYYFSMVRYQLDGSLDTTFNGTGKVLTAIGGGFNQGHTLVQQSDGKLVGAGFTSVTTLSSNDFGLLRYLPDGSLDTSFGNNGKLITSVGGNDYANSLIQQRDGKLLLGASAYAGGGYDFTLVRYESGQLDADHDGIVDGLDTDNDNDGVADASDNCPLTANTNQLNFDGAADGGDECDADDDNDSVADASDAFPLNPSESLDTDHDGIGNNADFDDDGDNYADNMDAYPLNPHKWKFPSCDFDGDADSDMLVRDLLTGLWKIFTVQASVVTHNATIDIPHNADTRHIAALDTDGDGDKDILTRSVLTGLWRLYTIQNGLAVNANGLGLYGHADWRFVVAGDFNGDAVDDVLLRNKTTGVYVVFVIMDNTVMEVKSFNAWLSLDVVPQGVGDFDGDGTDDLLVRQMSTGFYLVFRVLNGDVANTICICNIWRHLDYTFQFASDMNADGSTDVVIRGTGAIGDGDWWRFQINNNSATSTDHFNLFHHKSRVSLGAVGDYNGDGTNDVIVRVDDGDSYVAPVANGLVTGHSRIGNFHADQEMER